MAAASLGQVHRATLPSGREVVVKVQRPDARDVARDDMETLARLAGLADKHTAAGRRFGFEQLLGQFRRSLAGELDYRREARNLLKFRDLTKHYDLLVVPEPILDHSSSRVLTMERIEGRKVTDVGPLGLLDVDAGPMVEQLFSCYLRLMLDHGVLHADPHPGNLMLTDDGRLALLDLGMVATVPPRLQDKVTKLLLAISDGDGEEAAVVLAGMGHPLEEYDAAAFREEVAHLVSEAASAGAEQQAGTVLVELSRISGAHGLRPPAEMSMIGKALLNLDQTTLHLDPDFDPAAAIRSNLSELLASGLKVSPAGIMAAAIEAKEFTSLLPKRGNRILDALAEGEFTMRVRRDRRGAAAHGAPAGRQPGDAGDRHRGHRARRRADDAGADRPPDPRLPRDRDGLLPLRGPRRRRPGRLDRAHRPQGRPGRPAGQPRAPTTGGRG